MKEIELKEIGQSAHKDFAPVNVSEGITIAISRDIKDDDYTVEGNIDKGGKNIGRYKLNESLGSYFVNVEVGDLKRNTKREIVETVAAILLNLIPEEKEAE